MTGPSPQDGDSLIDLWLEYTKHTPSPERFRRWVAIHAIGAAGERRIWSVINGMVLYPNLFLFLVGPPGVGKSAAINPMSEVLRKSTATKIAPTDMSKQGLLDTLITCEGGGVVGEGDDGEAFDYHYMTIYISELSNFMSQYDGALAGLLTDLFDCGPMVEEKKRGIAGAPKVIPFPGISFIMGTATQNLGATISDEMWGSGFMARVIMVYSDQLIRPASPAAMFSVPKRSEAIADELDLALRRIKALSGEMIWEFEAQMAIWEFWTKEESTAPIHNRLANYTTRRWMHLAKLCMIAALSDERMIIQVEDFHAAKSWLLEVEALMPEIFKGMASHEDGQVYEELRLAMWNDMLRLKVHFLPIAWIWAFLAKRVSSYSIPRMIEVAENAAIIQRKAGTSGEDAMYRPSEHAGNL